MINYHAKKKQKLSEEKWLAVQGPWQDEPWEPRVPAFWEFHVNPGPPRGARYGAKIPTPAKDTDV